MLKTEELIKESDLLPKVFNAINISIENEWIKTAKRRLNELRDGKVKPISGEEVFKRVKERFEI
jgi:hypothetical protein